jgi:hypothetical protein
MRTGGKQQIFELKFNNLDKCRGIIQESFAIKVF